MTGALGALDERQRKLLQSWVPGATVVRDHSWGLVGTTVLEVLHEGRRLLVKAGDAADHHLAREIAAHREWLEPWTRQGRAAALVAADTDAKLLLRDFLEGHPVQGSAQEWDVDVHHQAGRLLRDFHRQRSHTDEHYEARQDAKALRWLEAPHGIDADSVTRLRAEITSWPAGPANVVPTHGDWQPRNWLVHCGEVRVIDLGRAELRPAHTDFVRLAAQQFRGHPEQETAFLDGYGSDPRDPADWRRTLVREAIGTAVWAHQVGDRPFEEQGLRMISDVLVRPGPP
ncbi:MAG: aminoglycoside phosphotransferase family protein [Mycobacteriales bacterium]|nr:aminoglycoside phosphotransferase family protein [Mycobacteriales bacterium]